VGVAVCVNSVRSSTGGKPFRTAKYAKFQPVTATVTLPEQGSVGGVQSRQALNWGPSQTIRTGGKPEHPTGTTVPAGGGRWAGCSRTPTGRNRTASATPENPSQTNEGGGVGRERHRGVRPVGGVRGSSSRPHRYCGGTRPPINLVRPPTVGLVVWYSPQPNRVVGVERPWHHKKSQRW